MLSCADTQTWLQSYFASALDYTNLNFLIIFADDVKDTGHNTSTHTVTQTLFYYIKRKRGCQVALFAGGGGKLGRWDGGWWSIFAQFSNVILNVGNIFNLDGYNHFPNTSSKLVEPKTPQFFE